MNDNYVILGYSFKTEHGLNFIDDNNRAWFLGIGTAADYYVNKKADYREFSNHLIGIPTYITCQYIHNIKKTCFTCKGNLGWYGYIYGWDTYKEKNFDGTIIKSKETDKSGECSHYYAGVEMGIRIPIANNGNTGLNIMAHWAGIWYNFSKNNRMGLTVSIDF